MHEIRFTRLDLHSLSLSTRSANTFGTFKSRLKTELFMSAYTT